MKTTILTLLATAAMPLAALAQDADASQDSDQADAEETRVEPADDHFHNVIYVTAAGVDRLDVIAGTSVLTGIALQRESSGQVGDMLESLPGVSASGFAPGASRPILRGFGGDRVRMLNDGISTLDVSGVSDDHAVAADPLIAERIEVLRGPAVLLYGSQAIGGAVNVVTKRIPPDVPDEPIHVDALAGFDTVSNLREGGLSIDMPFGANVAFHADASYRNSDNIEIPGFAASDGLRAELLADAAVQEGEGELAEAAALRDAANISGTLPSSFSETWSAGTGIAAFVGENSFGISFDYYDTSYGVPEAPGAGSEESPLDQSAAAGGEDGVSIGLQRYRFDMRAEFDLGSGFFDAVQTRAGWSDYVHTEFEGSEVGTVFNIGGVEGRVELVQTRRNGWGGSVGVQYSSIDFGAVGDETYIPANVTDSLALFTLQEIDFERFELEAGARYETTTVEASGLAPGRDFDSFSAALGGAVMLDEDFRTGVNLSRTERAPSAAELYAEGPHTATQQFEVGDPALGIEASWGAEAYLRGAIGEVTVNASLYRNWFTDFIYLDATEAVEEGFPVFIYRQRDADQWGVEAQVTFPLLEARDFSLLGDLRGAYTNAKLDNGDGVPRIPPLSLYGALEAQLEHFDLRGEVEWFDEQSNLAPLETPTDGFTHVNLSLAWHPFEGEDNFTLLAQVDNLFDAEGRRATSFTKDFVPLPGRNFRLSARTSF